MSDESYWLRFHNGKEIRVWNSFPYDDDILIRVEGDEEVCVLPGVFYEESNGSYGWRAVAPPGEGWLLDRAASGRKEFRICVFRRPRARRAA
jgi:hypothetical protein